MIKERGVKRRKKGAGRGEKELRYYAAEHFSPLHSPFFPLNNYCTVTVSGARNFCANAATYSFHASAVLISALSHAEPQ